MQLIFSFQSEWLKRKRSAASWLTVVGGLFVPAIILAARITQPGKTLLANASQEAWNNVFTQCWQYMSIFLLPMGITLAASLITQIEYRNNGWKQLHSTPQSLSIIFWAKLMVVMVMLLQFFLIFNIGVYGCGVIPVMILKDVTFPDQVFPIDHFFQENLKFFVRSLPILGLQYLLSLHIKNFMIPIGVGFGMLIASLIGVNWHYGYLFPYTYCSLQFMVSDNRIDPGVNIQVWAIGYFVAFTLVNYVLYRYRHEPFVWRRRAIQIVLVVTGAATLLSIFVWRVDHDIQEVNDLLSTAAKIDMIEANTGLSRFKATNKDLTSIRARMRYYNINGASIAVIHHYQIDWVKHYGLADVSTQTPVTAHTLFQPGSISKSINALGILKRYDNKQIDLFCDINNYLATWKFPYDKKYGNHHITLAQLLSHSAGLNVHGFGFTSYAEGDTLPTIYQILDGEPPAHTSPVRSQEEPGRRYRYSGGGTMISQLIAMDITGKPYADYIQETVLKPLNMGDSFFDQPPPPNKRQQLATGYSSVYAGRAVRGKYPIQPQQAAAGLWTTAKDLATMIVAVQKSLRGDADTFLHKSTAQLMLTPYNDKSATMGFFIDQHGSEQYFHHAAGNPGFSGKYYASMQGGNGVVVLVNTDDDPQFFEEIIRATAQVYHWPGFTPQQEVIGKHVIDLPQTLQNQYAGIYRYENRIIIVEKDSSGLTYTEDGLTWPMHFTTDSTFFNVESASSKKFQKKNGVAALQINNQKTAVVANKIAIKNVSSQMLSRYAGMYTEQTKETATIYRSNNNLWLSSTNAIAPHKLIFISDTDFFIDKLGGLFSFTQDKVTQKILGVKAKHNPDGDFILTKHEEIH